MQQEINSISTEIKENINMMIENGNLGEAEALLNQYKKIVPSDIEIYSIKSIILIKENKLYEAEKLIKTGLNIDTVNFDLFYNLAYLYDIQSRGTEAIAAYNIAKILCKDEELKYQIEKVILKLAGKEKKVYNVFLCGNIEQCINFEMIIKDWSVIGYIMDDVSIHEKCSKKIIQVERISEYNYDFIIILDEIKEKNILEHLVKSGVNKNNIYLFSRFKISVIEGLDYRIRELLYQDGIEAIITGSSYGEVGIKAELLSKKTINFAFSSQDLYYDYLLLKYLLNFANVKNSIKYVFIAASYYYFDYDMSKSIAKYRIHRYSNYLDYFHNNKDTVGIDIAKQLYEKRISMEHYYSMNKAKQNAVINTKDDEQEYVAKRNSTMNYNLTRKENISIFNEYLHLLKSHCIKPLIVICPTSIYYYKYFKNGYQKNKFYSILEKFQAKFDFQVLDYCNSNLFEDMDFWDYGHLNGKGSEKFTQLLNKEVEW